MCFEYRREKPVATLRWTRYTAFQHLVSLFSVRMYCIVFVFTLFSNAKRQRHAILVFCFVHLDYNREQLRMDSNNEQYGCMYTSRAITSFLYFDLGRIDLKF